jgi:aminopeptidase
VTANTLQAYARLLLTTGLNLQAGQKLRVSFRPEQRLFVRILTEEAYGLGAAYVFPQPLFDELTRARVDASGPLNLDFVPGWMEAQDREMIDNDWALLSLLGYEDTDVYQGVDSVRMSRMDSALQARRKYYREATMADRVCWCLAAVPTDGWARQVLGPNATAEDLWAVFVPIYGLDLADPPAFWKRKLEVLAARAASLTALNLDRIRFTGPGTDLSVGLVSGSSWEGGEFVSERGRKFAANLPTEEVYNTPDWRRTEGTVTVTRPVEVLGTEVEGAKFTFRNGRVVVFSASKNQDVLKQFLDRDGQANALGEVALVDGSSAIFQSQKVFHNILFDENAACHIALGAGYTTNVPGAENLDEAGRIAAGCNVSQVHVDFMIGSPEITVEAFTSDGQVHRLIDRGRFQ